MINNTPFGLAASVWTNDLGKAMRMIPHIKAGTVWVNMHTFLDPAVPFGGTKSSGSAVNSVVRLLNIILN